MIDPLPPSLEAAETYRVRGDMSQVEHLDRMPLGTRGGLSARHTFPLDGEYVIRVKLVETNLGTIRGLQDESQLETIKAHVRTEIPKLRVHARCKFRSFKRPVCRDFADIDVAVVDARKVQIVEMRYFAGLDVKEIAETLTSPKKQ